MAPDVLVLTEFRPGPGQALLELLAQMDYQATVGIPPRPTGVNCTCVLTRSPHEQFESTRIPISHHRWLAVRLPDHDLSVLGAHVPNESEAWNKADFMDSLVAFAERHAESRAVILGDLNTAHDEDCEGDPIRAAVYFRALEDLGWKDAWRQCNLGAREFTWYSHKQNGFRLDHCYVSPCLAPAVVASSYDHSVRTNGLSDHSLLLTTLRD